MEQLKENKATIYTAIIVAIVTFALTSFFGSMNKLDDAVTQERMIKYVDSKGEEILDRAKKYTDIQVDASHKYYESNIQHIEELLKSSDDKFETILNSIDERLNRIDKRINR